MALKQACRRKETPYPELVQPGSRARLVVLALEVGGRWSQEARTFVQLLAEARTQVGATSDEAHGTGVASLVLDPLVGTDAHDRSRVR